MNTYNHITVGVVRQTLEAGATQRVTEGLVNAVKETFEAWDEDQFNEDIEPSALGAREVAVTALEDLGAEHIHINSDASEETLAATWEAIRKYWTN